MRRAVAETPASLTLRLLAAGAGPDHVGRELAGLADAAAVRHLRAAENSLGPPPVPYLWLAAGSQGRGEQTALSDQDNALLLDDAYDPDRHAGYFAALAGRVCDGLNADGYQYCPGEMMANNPRWRQPLAGWRRCFADWMDNPAPKSLMLSTVLFDLRPVWGMTGLFDALHGPTLALAADNRLFLAHFAENALSRRPPLGFFGGLSPLSDGPHAGTMDLKHDGILPIVDLARLYALSGGIAAVNTPARLSAAAAQGVISAKGGADLTAAWLTIEGVRLEHQARRIAAGAQPDNFAPLDGMSEDAQRRLTAAFAVVKAMQRAVELAFPLAQF